VNTAVLSEINNHSLAERAYTLLEEKLVTLQLVPGSLVSEGDLIEMTRIGRTPVREAIQRLAQQELFEVIPRKGLLVAPVSGSSMLDILEARKPLERLVVHRAALNAKDDQRSALSAVARQLANAHERFDEFLRLDHALDLVLDECSGNPFTSAALAPLRSHCRRFWYFHRTQIQLSDAISTHSQMARLVARRDSNGAQKASDAIIAVLERLVTGVDRTS
jgi:DNA-binding GntR family transcriptional regulator